jgi:hypothetical protein
LIVTRSLKRRLVLIALLWPYPAVLFTGWILPFASPPALVALVPC